MDATEAIELKWAGLSGLADPGFRLWQQTVALQFWRLQKPGYGENLGRLREKEF